MNDFLHSNVPSKNPNSIDREGFVVNCVEYRDFSKCVVWLFGLLITPFVLFRRPCGFDLVFLEQTVSLIADEDADTQYLMQVGGC